MKILFWQWNAFMQKGIEKALEQLNIVYDKFFYQLNDWENDDTFDKEFRKQLKKSEYNAVFSVNYNPLISNVCEECGVTYIAWVYDSPIHIRGIESFRNSCNRIFFFDRGQAEYYQKQGYSGIFHMPLAADESVWDFTKNATDEKYQCDVALVGKLYQSDYNYLMGPLSQYYRGRMDGIIQAQGQLYGAYLLPELITDELMKELNEFYQKASGGKFQVKREEMEYTCACEVTGRERFMALSLLASRCKLNLYSGDSGKDIPAIHSCGYVDYYTQMPKAFRYAKINLNMSLKTIRTGIPLRVLDVLSCGGFLITNYQEELFEYFEPGVDLVVYDSVEDLVHKVMYYLQHDAEREQIARNGHKKVCELFTFKNQMIQILNQAIPDWNR